MHVTNIKVKPMYGSRVAVVPVPRKGNVLREATREQLAILLALMEESETSYLTLSEKTGATRAQIEEALLYWQKAGVLSVEDVKPAAQKEETPQKVKSKTKEGGAYLEGAAQLPHYNTSETARFLKKNPGVSGLIECCQQEMGKMFNTSEVETIIGLLDYLSLDPEYVLLLCAHSAKRGKRSLRYIEKTAISYHDEGILTYDQLEAHLKQVDEAADMEVALREMFGFGKRALVKKEKEAFFRWTAEWHMPLAVIERAYEIAVTRTKEPSVPYTNAVLERWNAEGIRTPEDVERFVAARRPASAQQTTNSSFDTDDFFEAALDRSYGKSSKTTKDPTDP